MSVRFSATGHDTKHDSADRCGLNGGLKIFVKLVSPCAAKKKPVSQIFLCLAGSCESRPVQDGANCSHEFSCKILPSRQAYDC